MKRVPSILKRPERRSRTGDPITSYGYSTGSPVLSGILVTPQIALTFTAVFAAINVISRDIACLPWGVYSRLANGGKRYEATHPVTKLLAVAPNEESNAQRYRQAEMGWVLGWGNGYSEIRSNGRGEVVEIWGLSPQTTKPKRTDGKKLYYELDNGKRTLWPDEVVHVAGLSFDGIAGYSPINQARQAVGLGIAAEEFGASLFGNGAIPKGILKTPKRLSKTALQNLRQNFYDVHQGTKNAHGLAILEEGVEWQQTTIPPEDAQFLATRQFQVLEVARIFSIPPHKLGDYSQAHLANVEESNLDYLSTTLAGWVCAVEAEYNRKLLTESERNAGLFICADLSALLRGNMAARVAYYKGLSDLGVLSPNQIASMENLNPIGPDGDKRLVPLNMTTLEKAGETTPSKPTPAPAPTPEPKDSKE